VGVKGEETLTQRFSRLRCEVTELTEELDSLTESAQEGSLVGLHRQVAQLRQQLEGCQLLQEGSEASQVTNQKALLDEISSQIRQLAQQTGNSDTSLGSVELYLRGGTGGTATAANLHELDRRLARLEALVGSNSPDQRRVLSAETDGLALCNAVQILNQRRYVQAAQHLAHIEGRLAALNNRMDSLGQQKSLMQKAKTGSQVSALYDSLERSAGLMAVLPQLVACLTDLAELQQAAQGWGSRLADTAAQQETTDKAGLQSCLIQNHPLLEVVKVHGNEVKSCIEASVEDLHPIRSGPYGWIRNFHRQFQVRVRT
jgi:hypothetical protein